MIGKILAHYEITSRIGKGGMGEVYQAKDRKLGRDVAIKVLPEEFARDTDRVARFQREAQLLASLNHSNIAAIYGLEESGGINFLVLELVKGDTLSEQIKKGPIPVEESLKLALQIAEALEAAHEKGVIHRDLKPANIKVTPDGTKVTLTAIIDNNRDIYIWDLVCETMTRVTFEIENGEAQSIWTPDGKRVVFTALRGGGIYWKAADGTGEVETIFSAPDMRFFPWSWSSDGKTLSHKKRMIL